jgi:hypothetical protein
MKTTIEIPDPLLDRLRARAARERTTMRAIVLAAIQLYLSTHAGSRGSGRFALRDCTFKGEGLQPGVREGDWAVVRELAYESRGGAGAWTP